MDLAVEHPELEGYCTMMIRDIVNENSDEINALELYKGLFDGKLYATKLYKERTGKNLIDAKHSVERYFEEHGFKFRAFT